MKFNKIKQLPQAHMACMWLSWDKYSHWTAKLGLFHLMLISYPILPSFVVHQQRSKQGNQNIDNLLGTESALWKTVQKGREHMAIASLFGCTNGGFWLLFRDWESSLSRPHFLGYLSWWVHSLKIGKWLLTHGLGSSVLLPLVSIFLWPCELPCIMFCNELSNDSLYIYAPEYKDIDKGQTVFTLEDRRAKSGHLK